MLGAFWSITLDGRQAEAMTLPVLMKGFPVEWDGQQARLTEAAA